MANFKTIAYAFAAAAAVASASDVTELKKDSFPDFVKENSLVLAEFFAPWCGHCQMLAPEYEEAATTLKEKNVKLVKVDCTEEAELCQLYGVEGYPTLKVFRGLDNISPYSGPRKAKEITSYMIKQTLPAVSSLNKDSLEEFKTADKVVLVAYFAADDKASNETFGTVAEEMRDTFLFGATNDAALAKAEGVELPAIVLYKGFDEGKVIFSGKLEKEAIAAFAKTESIPLVGEVGPDTYSDYMAAQIPLAYIFAETPEERAEFATLLKPVAEKHKGKISFATIDAKAYGAHAGNLNLKIDVFPAFAIQETVKNSKYPYDQEKKIALDDIHDFVQQVLDGKIEPSIKSEPIPETQEGPVVVVVAKNYNEIVFEDKDVLVEFYAPWCGHCKAMAPVYEELAGLYTANKDWAKKITIAKVDATANDVPDEVSGFPTIKMYPAGAKDAPITYSGSRTIEDLVKFIAENGKHKIEAVVPEREEKPEAEEAEESMGKAAEAATEAAAEASEESKDKEAAKEDVHDEL